MNKYPVTLVLYSTPVMGSLFFRYFEFPVDDRQRQSRIVEKRELVHIFPDSSSHSVHPGEITAGRRNGISSPGGDFARVYAVG